MKTKATKLLKVKASKKNLHN